MLIFDGWEKFSMGELRKLFEYCGAPKSLISLNMNRDQVTKMYRKKKEMDEAAELTEEDLDNISKNLTTFQEFQDLFKEFS